MVRLCDDAADGELLRREEIGDDAQPIQERGAHERPLAHRPIKRQHRPQVGPHRLVGDGEEALDVVIVLEVELLDPLRGGAGVGDAGERAERRLDRALDERAILQRLVVDGTRL